MVVTSVKNEVFEKPVNILWWELALMFLMLSISGNPYIGIKIFEPALIACSIIPLIHIIRNHKQSVSFRTILIFIFLIGYEIMHAIMFSLDYSLTIFKLTLVLLFASTTVDILKHKFIVVLTKTMVLISLVSFAFVFISYTPIHSPLYELALSLFPVEEYNNITPSTILVFTFCREYYEGSLPYVRNAGIFWESGAFAVFLNITLFLHYSSKSIKSVRDLFDRDAKILLIALMSTTSTTGAISLMIQLFFFSLQLKSALKYILVSLIIIMGSISFTSVDFLGKKISKQLKESQNSNNRFGAALKDFENILERPILGWSRRIEVVFNTSVRSAKTHRPNGFTNFLRNYGLLYFSVYFMLVYSSFKKIVTYHQNQYTTSIPLFGVMLLFVISFSEVIFDLPFLKSLIFLYSSYMPSTDFEHPRPFSKPLYY